MELISKPAVYLLSKQMVVEGELDRFLADHGVAWQSDSEVAAEVVTETAGRVCYMSFAKPRPGGNAAYLTHIKEVGHGSVLEHAVWSFLFTGVSRTLTHELVRHRAGWAYSQLSQRYVDESVAELVVPPDLWTEVDAAVRAAKLYTGSESPDLSYESLVEYNCFGAFSTDEEWAGYEWLEAVAHSQLAYRRLGDYQAKKAAGRGLSGTESRKFARQSARSVLPNATETKITVTANARALRHFLEQRGSRFAEPEIRVLANALLDVLVEDAPNLFSDYARTPLPDGTFEITTPHDKV